MREQLAILLLCLVSGIAAAASPVPTAAALDAEVARAMQATSAQGIAIAVIDDGQVVRVLSRGSRNAKNDPLQRNTIMYGASLTKAAFAYTVMQLVEESVLDLDTSIADYLPKPLPEYDDEDTADRYAAWAGLAGDNRWRDLTPRILLTHSPGFANFGFLEPDGVLRFHFDPGTRYAYSGDGMILMQFVLERGLGLDLRREMQKRVFDRFDMPDTDMMWRPAYARNLADGWKEDGSVEPHDERSKPRAAGSMDTTIADMARFAAGYIRGDGLSPDAFNELLRPQLPIRSATQFPSLAPELPLDKLERRDLAAGLGVVVFEGPQGPAFFKGGHNDSTANTMVCVRKSQRCVVILSNDVRAERAFPQLVRFAIGETGAPWRWEYGDMAFWTSRK